MSKLIWKKLVSLCVVGILAMSLAACRSTGNDGMTGATGESSMPAAEAEAVVPAPEAPAVHSAIKAVTDAQQAGIALITASELRTAMASSNAPVVVDVLPASSYETSHIEGAVNIPLNELAAAAEQRLPNKDAKIVVYCASYSCPASTEAAKTLKNLGYTNVMDYKGGIKEWTLLGLPVAAVEKPAPVETPAAAPEAPVEAPVAQ